MKKHKSAWLIIAQTNLHVGDENLENIGIIDKTIQRDATTDIPCIHSSSLKGAIKEFIAYLNEKEGLDISCKEVFGSDYRNDKDTKKGNTIFFDAELLALPVQWTNEGLFKLVYQAGILKSFVSRLKTFGVENVEDKTLTEKIKSELNRLKGNIAELKEMSELENKPDWENWTFKELCTDEHLPIIARNKLDTGEDNGNLWYEQVLPTWSVLGTLICTDDDKLENALDGRIIQIGANATVGYGYCKFIKLA